MNKASVCTSMQQFTAVDIETTASQKWSLVSSVVSLYLDKSCNLTWASCAAHRLLCLNSGPRAIGAAPITAGPLIHPMSIQGSIVSQWCDPCVEERLPLEHEQEQDSSSTLYCSFLL